MFLKVRYATDRTSCYDGHTVEHQFPENVWFCSEGMVYRPALIDEDEEKYGFPYCFEYFGKGQWEFTVSNPESGQTMYFTKGHSDEMRNPPRNTEGVALGIIANEAVDFSTCRIVSPTRRYFRNSQSGKYHITPTKANENPMLYRSKCGAVMTVKSEVLAVGRCVQGDVCFKCTSGVGVHGYYEGDRGIEL